MNRQFEKKPGSIWSVTSRSSLAIPIFSFCVYTTAGKLFQTALHYAQRCIIGLSRSPHSFCSATRTAPDFVQKNERGISDVSCKGILLLSYPSSVQLWAHRHGAARARSLFWEGHTLCFILSLMAYLCSKVLTSDMVHTLCPLLPLPLLPQLCAQCEQSYRSTCFSSFFLFVCAIRHL